MPNNAPITRIFLRNDTLSAWTAANPVLGKGEIAVVFDPTVSGERAIRLKAGDGVNTFNDLLYIADYDAQLAELVAELAGKQANLTAGTGIDITNNTVGLDLSEVILNCGGAE